jgi:hypothetical protein
MQHFPQCLQFCQRIDHHPGNVYHSPPYSTEVRNKWSYTYATHIRFLGVDRDYFTLPIVTKVTDMVREGARIVSLYGYFPASFLNTAY